MDPLKTGKIISEARKKKKMTQNDLAVKLFVSDKAISKWERGLCFPDISLLIPLTEILGISLYELLKGEKMRKEEEVEETLKKTIDYSNEEIRKNKKKTILISLIVMFIMLFASIMIIKNVKENDMSAITDKDTIYQISEYKGYKTTLSSEDGEKIENLFSKLPLSWSERIYNIKKNKLTIKYDNTYKEVVKAYNDETYVKIAMIHSASVLFTTVSDLEKIEYKFDKDKYMITKEDVKDFYSVDNLEELLDDDEFSAVVSKPLEKEKYVNETFEKLFN